MLYLQYSNKINVQLRFPSNSLYIEIRISQKCFMKFLIHYTLINSSAIYRTGYFYEIPLGIYWITTRKNIYGAKINDDSA
jgi:hypothetical protein